MSKGSVLILGGRSDIGIAIAHSFAKIGYDIQLAARNAKSLEADKYDIQLRNNVKVSLSEFDALNISTHEDFIKQLPTLPEIAICTVGYIDEQEKNEKDLHAAKIVMRSNYEGPASILSVLANHFEVRGSGCLVGISSVAGERGRATNYIYGSAKAGFTAFLSGLRNRLEKKRIHVITVLPGYVDTKMTKNMKLPKSLTSTPNDVSEKILSAVQKNKNIIYVKPIWRLIMLLIRNIPESIFKKLNL